MGIKKNVTVGKHTDVTLLTFGTGDILVSSGRYKENNIKVLTFAQDVEKPIEDWNPPDDDIEHSTDEYENIVVLEFDKVESVDVIIRKLWKVREALLKSVSHLEGEGE